tara:strand:- start:14 stop:193 length:180 start_codon:yes stop_codon:yes gene_type:complete
MNSLKSKLPTIDIKTDDYFSKPKKESQHNESKEKYLDTLLSKDFLKNYFTKTKKLNKKK